MMDKKSRFGGGTLALVTVLMAGTVVVVNHFFQKVRGSFRSSSIAEAKRLITADAGSGGSPQKSRVSHDT